MDQAITSENRKNQVVRDERGRIVSGTPNPYGRPKDSFSLIGLLRKKLQEVPPEFENQKKTYAEILIQKILQKAIKDGDQATQKLVFNYIEGMPKQLIGSDPENPIQILPSEIIFKNGIRIHAESENSSEGNE